MKRPFLLLTITAATFANVSIIVNTDSGRVAISPNIYGKNGSLSDEPSKPTSDSLIHLYRESGLKLFRENSGNNATKYNWNKKLTSHPDWFNTVVVHDWDIPAKIIQDSFPTAQGFFAFQLLGMVANNTDNNWNDWNWKNAHGGKLPAVEQNLAGGGVPDSVTLTNAKALVEGDISKYLQPWPADSTAGILDHWFGKSGIGLNPSNFSYWNMDNEPDIWSSTHDDVLKDTITFDTFMNKYIAVAKAVRSKGYPVKLVGPVFCNDWFWWTWNGNAINDNGVKRSPMEMFIKRIGEEEKSSGLKLLDVFDLHFYPQMNSTADIGNLLQVHRVFFDTSYVWPKSNGIHAVDGKWGKGSANYTFARVRQWMKTYLGEERPLGLSEFGAVDAGGNLNASAVTYASILGTFADNGVELFSPWDWKTGWWEVLHLYSKNAQAIRVKSSSDNDSLVSAYSSISSSGDSLTVILVNRDQSNVQSTSINLKSFVPSNSAQTLTLSNISSETFKSDVNNGLKKGMVTVNAGSCTVSLDPLSIVAIKFGTTKTAIAAIQTPTKYGLKLVGNSIKGSPNETIKLFDLRGKGIAESKESLSLNGIGSGSYIATMNGFTVKVNLK